MIDYRDWISISALWYSSFNPLVRRHGSWVQGNYRVIVAVAVRLREIPVRRRIWVFRVRSHQNRLACRKSSRARDSDDIGRRVIEWLRKVHERLCGAQDFVPRDPVVVRTDSLESGSQNSQSCAQLGFIYRHGECGRNSRGVYDGTSQTRAHSSTPSGACSICDRGRRTRRVSASRPLGPDQHGPSATSRPPHHPLLIGSSLFFFFESKRRRRATFIKRRPEV